MKGWRVVRARLAGVFQKARFESEMDEELRFHLQMRAQEYVARGWSPAEASAEAERQFGNTSIIKDAYRDVGGGGGFESFLQDIRLAARELKREKAFTATAVTALVLGIGANTALFTVLSSVLLRPLPYPQPERLMSVWSHESTRPNEQLPLSYPDFADMRERNQSFEAFGAFLSDNFIVSRPGHAGLHMRGAALSADVLSILRTRPQIGRAFRRSDEEPGARPVLISDRLWREEFAAAADVVGAPLNIDGHEYSVIGVMPAGFRFPVRNDAAEFWTTFSRNWDPFAPGTDPPNAHRDGHWLGVVGRLRDGKTAADAEADLSEIAKSLAAKFPNTNHTIDSCQVRPLLADITRLVRPALLMLIGAAACVLCVACANVANLLLARATTRQKEISLRAALGAGRMRIIRQLLTESLLLGTIAGAIGLVVALLGTRLIVAFLPADFPRATEIVPDVRVLVFTGILALVTSALFGFAPAWRAASSPLAETLNDASRNGTGSASGRALRNAFVIAQMTLAFVLVSAACFLLRSVWQLEHMDPGFDPHQLLTAKMALPDRRDAEGAVQSGAFFADLTTRLRGLGGVSAATAVAPLPFTSLGMVADFEIVGRPMLKVHWPRARTAVIALDYFSTMAIPLLRGRDFTEADDRDSTPVAIVNETLARMQFPDGNVLGQKIRPGLSVSGSPPEREIVGVVGDVKSTGLAGEQRAEVYIPHAQCPLIEMALVVRSDRAPEDVLDDIRWVVESMDKTLPIYEPRMMTEFLDDVIAHPRLTSTLVAAFAILALMLNAIGVYGMMSYAAAQRRHEIGVRLAFGAPRSAVLQLLLREGVRISGWASLAGGLATASILPLVRKLAPQSAGPNFVIIGGVAFLLVAMALLASWLPAHRAANEDPLRAIGER